MFGMLRMASCRMSIAERRQWQAYVCGVCLALRDEYGHPSRMATNTDAALLALLHDSLADKQPGTVDHFCLLRRPNRVTVPDPDSPGLPFAAFLALLMAATKLLDRVQDGEIRPQPARMVASRVAQRWLSAAETTADELGFDASQIVDQVRRQPELESVQYADFPLYSEPTELSVASAFRHLAIMTGEEKAVDSLHNLGRAYGRIMYLLDSVQDYGKDMAAQRFNPLAALWSSDDGPSMIHGFFRDAMRSLRISLSSLELTQPALTGSLLVRQLGCNGNGILRAHLPGTAELACQTSVGVLANYDPDYLDAEVRQRNRPPSDEYPPDRRRGEDDEGAPALCECGAYSCIHGCDCDGGDGCCGDCNCCEGECCCGNCDCGDGCDCGCDGCDCS